MIGHRRTAFVPLMQASHRKTTGSGAGRQTVCSAKGQPGGAAAMNDAVTKPRTRVRTKVERPRMHKVILVNDDFTPREFVVQVLKAVFRMNETQAYNVMMTAHQKGACVIAVYTGDVADTKAKEATEMGKAKGYPLYFTTEKEE
jgi:ATP-dependent Clp protease adaptor protein ClpS